MSVGTLPPWKTDQPPPVPVRRFTVTEYQQMGQLGVLTPQDRVELLEGWIVPKMNHNPAHGMAIELIDALIRTLLLSSDWHIRAQLPITFSDSEPEPDFAIVKGSPRDRSGRHPFANEIGLLIEVADSSLNRDRTTKARLYARASIPVYWIVNLAEGQLEILSQPTGPSDEPAYQQTDVYGPDESAPLFLDGREAAQVSVRDLLP